MECTKKQTKWTEKQEEAINLRDKNMLVAAAAGSGKTAVLVERIKQLIIREGVSVNEMLVVTFTNAAAAEMREKIVEAVTSEIETNSGDTAFLRKQLNILYKANISTFHAFALEVIHRFFHLLDIDPNFKICDEAQEIILKSDAMENLFEEMFEQGDLDFLNFLNDYASGKNENAVKEMILEVYKTVQSVLHPWQWLEESTEMLAMNREDFLQSAIFSEIHRHISKELLYAKENYQKSIELFEEAGALKFAEKCKADAKNIEEAIEVFDAGDLEGFGERLKNISYARMVTTKEEKEAFDEVKALATIYRTRCKDTLKDIQEDYFMSSFDQQILDMNRVYPQAKTLVRLVEEFRKRYQGAKSEKKLVDFNDIEHYALEILANPQAAEEYREKFKYIFVDEYQDSNVIQDTLISAIKGENNVFMVGDVKQSIYKFRLAEPELFMEKYEKFKNEGNVLDQKIDLNANFRSKGNVINAVNFLFEKLMDGYDEAAALKEGVKYEGDLNYPAELHILDQKISDDMELDEEIKDLKAAEMEAFIAGKLIKEALGKPIFLAKEKVEKPLTKRDIVILMRGQKNYADKFQQILMDMDIPTHINDSDGYFDTLEIQIFLNLLRVIDNRRQDVALISALHSSIFGFSVEELAAVRTACKTTSYFEAFYRYATQSQEEVSPNEADLVEKCARVLENLAEWKSLSQIISLDELIWKLLWDTGFYTFMGALPSGAQRQANLRALIDKAVQFQASQMKGLYGFINYIDAIKDKKVPMGQVTLVGENDDVVRIMTIHKSKGLEFPMVIVAGMGKRFNNANARNPVDIHKNIGLGLRYVNRQEHYYKKTLIQMAIANKRKREDMEEEIRILYVAFTRAKDRLVLLGSVKDAEKFMETKGCGGDPDILRAGCYLDMVVPVISETASKAITLHHHGPEEIFFDSRDARDNKERLRTLFEGGLEDGETGASNCGKKSPLYERLDKQLSFTYGYDYARLLKSKFSVSKINQIGRLIEDENMTPQKYEQIYYESVYEPALAVPTFAAEEKKGFTAAERGTLLHSVLEHWDFKEGFLQCGGDGDDEKSHQSESAAMAYAERVIEDLEKRQLLTGEEALEAVKHRGALVDFQRSELGKRLAHADKILKETPFNLMKEIKGEEIIVQGIIDCCFEENGSYVLLDYKTNRVNNPRDPEELAYLKETYREQIGLYREALETVKGLPVKEAYIYMLNARIFIPYD